MQSSGSQVTYRIIYTNNIISHISGRRSAIRTRRGGRKSTDDDDDDDDVRMGPMTQRITKQQQQQQEEEKKKEEQQNECHSMFQTSRPTQTCNLIELFFLTHRQIHINNNIFPCSLPLLEFLPLKIHVWSQVDLH